MLIKLLCHSLKEEAKKYVCCLKKIIKHNKYFEHMGKDASAKLVDDHLRSLIPRLPWNVNIHGESLVSFLCHAIIK